VAPTERGLRAIHQQVLRSFATTGGPPAAADLDETAARHATTASTALAALHAEDFLQLADGQIRAAYPFSAVPTAHLVDIDGRPRLHAMCAIDALGVAAMLDAAVTITSADPRTGDPVIVTVAAGGRSATWHPPSAVVFCGRQVSSDRRSSCAGGPSLPAAADVTCGYVNFFASAATAAAWAGANPQAAGEILDQAAALQLGSEFFGPLLAEIG
jgi:hypothetical protein